MIIESAQITVDAPPWMACMCESFYVKAYDKKEKTGGVLYMIT